MKKIIGILVVTLSISTFAADTNVSTNKNSNSSTTIETVTFDLTVSDNINQKKRSEVSALVREYEIKQALIDLDIQDIDLKIHREMLGETPNLKTINNLIDKKSKLIGELEKNIFEINFKVKEILS